MSDPLTVISRDLPGWASGVLFGIAAVAAVVGAVSAIAGPVTALARLMWSLLPGRWLPWGDLNEFLRRRSLLAGRMLDQLVALDSHESWQDSRFTELEAEVEVVGGRERIFRRLQHSPTRRGALRREKSLTQALGRSGDYLVMLAGDPGSGKSIALRHLATQLARRVSRNGASSAEIPVYVNLKGFRPDGAPTPDAVGQFIQDAVSRFNDIDIEAFVREALRLGGAGATRRSGPGWLLLFDSFDEIPEILSATDASSTVRAYAQAIADFVAIRHDRVRAIVASREFRGPAGFGLARFRIVNLTDPQQKILVRRAVPDSATRRLVTESAALPPAGFAQLLRNPMFLSLVCEHANLTGQFPETVHEAYETCMTARIEKHIKAVGNKYGLTTAQLRAWAETAAFCMAVSDGLGLSPSRLELAKAMAQAGGPGSGQATDALDALVLAKLARDTDQLAGSGGPTFTFTHRRVQEYFATRVLLRTPSAVGPVTLLTDGRWRETAVTILQTQPPTAAGPLLSAAAQQLRDGLARHTPGERFSWPDGALHTLGILAQGTPGPAGVGPPAQEVAGQVMRTAWTDGRIEERVRLV